MFQAGDDQNLCPNKTSLRIRCGGRLRSTASFDYGSAEAVGCRPFIFALPALVLSGCRRSGAGVLADRSDAAGRRAPAVVVRLSNIGSHWNIHVSSVPLCSVGLSVSSISIGWIVSISDVVLAERRTTLSTASAWNHPAKQVVRQLLISTLIVAGLSMPPCATLASSAVVGWGLCKQSTHSVVVTVAVAGIAIV